MKLHFRKILFLFLFCFAFGVLFFSQQSPVLAQGSLQDSVNSQGRAFAGERGAGYRKPRDPREIASLIINTLLGLLGILFVIYLIYGGSLIMMAGGASDRVELGKKVITRAIVGIVIIGSAYSITIAVTKIAAGDSLSGGTPDCVYDRDTSQWYTTETANSDTPTFCPNPPSGL